MRGKRKSAKSVINSLVFAGLNPDGAKSKMTTIKKLIRESKASIVTIQETKYVQSGQMNFDGFARIVLRFGISSWDSLGSGSRFGVGLVPWSPLSYCYRIVFAYSRLV